MKHQRELSLWLLTLVACSGAVSTACGDEAGVDDPSGGTGGSAGTSAGLGALGGSSAGVGGAPHVAGSLGSAGTMPLAGSAATAGAGVSGGSGGAVSGGSASGGGESIQGGSSGSGGAPGSPFGVVSCQPAFEVACKPTIEFVNGDPNGRGKVFTNAIPDPVATMQDIACTVCSILYREPGEIPQNKHPDKIRLVLDTHGGVAQAGGGQIQFDLDYINSWANRSADQIEQEMMGVLQHETVHLYQNYGNGGTGEGMADTVRTRGGYYPRSRWQPGGSWHDAYTTSGFFYSWLTGPCAFHTESYPMNDFDLPYKLNEVLAGKSGDSAFTAVDGLLQQTFGKSADQLWQEYQNTAF
jgi:hypothetical protein